MRTFYMMGLVLFLSGFVFSVQAWWHVSRNDACPTHEKYVGMSSVEKLMYGSFTPQFIYELVRAMPTHKTVIAPVNEYRPLCENALKKISERRAILKDMIDACDLKAEGLVQWLWATFCNCIGRALNGMPLENDIENTHHNDLVVAFNNISAMKIRLKKTVFGCDDSLQVSLRDVVLVAHWSNGWSGWQESNPPKTCVVLDDGNVQIYSKISTILYYASHWERMRILGWLRFEPGKKKQPVYTNENFCGSRLMNYTMVYSPYCREVLSEDEKQPGELWGDSKDAPFYTEQKELSDRRKVWLKFPFEIGYDATKQGCYNVKKKSRYQFIDGTIMDNKNNPYLNSSGQKCKKGFMSGRTAQDATWSYECDVNQLYADDVLLLSK